MAVAAAQRRQARRLASELRDAVVRHHLLTFASAVSFRALVALVPAIVLCLMTAVLVVSIAPKLGSGALHFVLGVGRWLVAAVLLGVAVGVLVRYAPAEHPRPRWASMGSIAIVGAWIVLSLVFRVWVSDVSNFKTGIGFLTAFLVLGAYIYLSVLVFIIGVQLDELLRKREEGSLRV